MKNLLAILFVLFCTPVFGQLGYWENLTPLPGGSNYPYTIMGMTDDGHVYGWSIGDSSFLRSSDFGNTWQYKGLPFGIQIGQYLPLSVAANGKLYIEKGVATSPERRAVYVSSDAGETWSVKFDSSQYFSLVQTANNHLFAIRDTTETDFSGRAVFESVDDGLHWKPILYKSKKIFLRSLAVNQFDQLVINGTVDVETILKPDATGNNWKELAFFTQSEPTVYSKIMTTSGKRFLASLDKMIVYLADSTRIDVTYDSLTNSNNFHVVGGSLAIDQDGGILLSTSIGLYKSFDDGESWVFFKNQKHLNFPLQKRLPNGEWLVIQGSTFTRSVDGLSTFQISTTGINLGRRAQLAFIGSDTVYAQSDIGLWLSTDDCQTWELKRFAVQYQNHTDASGLVLLASVDSLLISTDFGSTFIAKPLNIANNQSISNIAFDEGAQNIFLTGPFGTVRSINFGDTWSSVADSAYLKRLEVHPSGALFGQFGEYSGPQYKTNLKKSTDGGLAWTTVFTGCNAFVFDEDGNIFNFNGKRHKSIDLGETWEQVTGGGYLVKQKGDILISDESEISRDLGATWTKLPVSPLGNISIYNFYEIDNGLRVYGGDLFRSKNSVLDGASLIGTVKKDADADCSTPDATDPLKNWLVKAENGTDTWFANTDSTGKYSMFVDTGSYEISIRPPLAHLLWEACDDTLNIALPELLDTTEADFLVKALADCPYLGVDLAVSPIQPCFSSYGSAAWCNYGTETADSAYLDLTLDPLLGLTSSSLPGDSIGGGVWRFQLGSIAAGECGNLWFEFVADCDSTVVGQAICLTAHIYPDSLCVDVPGWSGALLKVTATCVNDTSVNFKIQNIGNAPSQPLEYIIVEDDVVLRTGQPTIYDVLAIKNELVSMPDGHFFRLETEQEPGYPLGNVASAFSINCGAATLSETVLWYNLDDGPLAFDNECAIAVASYDPNDKTGLPLGYGPAHFIEANTDLEYTIRFQNTGTAAAHFVVIRDTLSEKLDPMSIRPGAASHPFSWKMEGNGFVSFRFDDINLPDSSANEAASHGFVSFKISQKPDLPDGTLIENRAAIYFDYNGAVQTNTTQHRIGHDFIEIVETSGPESISPKIKIWPNPLSESAVLTFEGLPKNDQHRLVLTDISGKNLRDLPFSGDKIFFRRDGLPSGLYFFEIKNQSGAGVFSGKLMLD